LRVLHVINSVSPSCGGTTTAVWSVLDSLRLSGVQTDLVTTNDDGPGRFLQVPLGEPRLERGHRVVYFPRQTHFYAVSTPLAHWVHRNAHHYDIVDAHGLFTFAPLAAAALAGRRGVPFVLRPSGVLNRWGRTHRRPALKRSSIRLLESPLLRRAARVVFTSRSELDEARELGLPFRPAVLPLGLDLPDSPPAASAGPDHCGEVPQLETILFLARIAPIKNLDVLLHAFALVVSEFPGLRLVVAGDGPRDLVRSLQELATALRVAERVDWRGFISGDAKEWALRSATLLVLPSESENFGLAALEAMARGVPVIVTRGVGLAPDVEQAQAGLVCAPTPADLARCMLVLLRDTRRRAACGKAAGALFERRFSLAATGRALRDLYEEVLAPGAVTGLP
jgi:glycosyltransferase involved in cell wall biosynthesis